MSNKWDGTSNNVALRVAGKSCNWLLEKNHVQGDLNRVPTSNANPYLKKIPHPVSSSTGAAPVDYEFKLTYGGTTIPQTPVKKNIQLYRLSVESLKMDTFNNVGNIVTKSQYSISAGSGIATDALCATYDIIPQHLVFADLTTNGINCGLSVIDEPLIVSDVLGTNSVMDGAAGASILYKDCIVGFSIVAKLKGYQNCDISSV